MDNNKKSPNEEQGYAEEQGKIDAKNYNFMRTYGKKPENGLKKRPELQAIN